MSRIHHGAAHNYQLLFSIANKWIFVITGSIKGLFDGLWAGPADEVEVGSCLVVRTAGTCTAKGLLANHSASGLVVIIDVACGILEYLCTLTQGLAVVGKNGTC